MLAWHQHFTFLSSTFILNVSEFVYLPSNYSMAFPSFTTLVEEVDTTFVEIHKKLLLNLSHNSPDRKEERLLHKWFHPLHYQPPAVWKSECCLLTSCFHLALDARLNICKRQRTIRRGKGKSGIKFTSRLHLTWSAASIRQTGYAYK